MKGLKVTIFSSQYEFCSDLFDLRGNFHSGVRNECQHFKWLTAARNFKSNSTTCSLIFAFLKAKNLNKYRFLGHLECHQQCFITKTLQTFICKKWFFEGYSSILSPFVYKTKTFYNTKINNYQPKEAFLNACTTSLDSLMTALNASFGQDKKITRNPIWK